MKLWRQFLGRPARQISPAGEGGGFSLAVAPDVHVSVHDGGLAILDISSGRVFLCNRTGARIWKGLEAGLNVEAISQEISRECGVSRQLVSRHTSAFLREVESRGLVTRKVGRS